MKRAWRSIPVAGAGVFVDAGASVRVKASASSFMTASGDAKDAQAQVGFRAASSERLGR